ncbi:cbb3-type cytochrome c oxidase subunit I [Sulfodiicoccus acidiphilus]
MRRVSEYFKIALTTTNASDIGIMYIILALVSLVIGSADASMIRVQLTFNDMSAVTYYNAVSLHGIFMIFFMVMPFSTGLGNYLVPRMIGARDLYWPKINALSFWILVPAVIMTAVSPLFGPINTGWYMYAPLSTDLAVNGGYGVDLVEIALIVAGLSTTLTGINFIMTILRLRKVKYFKMPLFAWSFFATAILMMVALPPLTGGLVMAFLERNWNLPFFNYKLGGDPVLWQQLFWFFGHPEVYILILPAMGIIGEILPRMVGRPIYGYKALALSSMAIAFLSVFSVWMHHMFVSVINPIANLITSAMTMAIAIPSGIKVLNWTATLYGGRLRFTGPAIAALGFIALFLVGGITGVFFPLIPLDYAFNGTYLVVGHFHYMVFAILVGLLGGVMYYFPYFTGKRFDHELGKTSMLMIVVGAFVIATGMTIDGVLGMPRRYAVVPAPMYQPFQNFIDVGAVIEGLGLLLLVGTLIWAWLRGPRVVGLDPWGGEAIGLPDFNIRPVALPLTFGKEMDGSEPEHRHGTFYPAVLGLMLSFPAIGFLLILHGMLPEGLLSILAFLGFGVAWMYHDYFKPSTFAMPHVGSLPGVKVSSTVTSPQVTTESEGVPTIERGIEQAKEVKTPILLFIIAEIFLFSSFIGGYLYVRNITPSAQLLPPLRVDWYGLPLAMTVILLSSSIPAHFSHHFMMKGKEKLFKATAALTFLMGLTFLSGQIYEFTHIVHFTPQTDVFTAFFYSIVWLHGFHVMMGLTLWGFTLLRTTKIRPFQAATMSTYYWHFVDAIWVVVFTMLYLQLPIYHP